jgi:hypothetical protein
MMGAGENQLPRRTVARYIFLTWVAYLVFVLVSDWNAFGLTPQPEHTLKWSAVRVATFTFWLLCSACIMWFRRPPADWNSFFGGALTTGLIAVVALPSLAPEDSSYIAAGLSICFYSMVSGFLCLSVRKTSHAAIYGMLLFPAQVVVDGAAHLASGLFRLH